MALLTAKTLLWCIPVLLLVDNAYVVAQRQRSRQRPVVNNGQALCNRLKSSDAAKSSSGLLCLQSYPSDKDHLTVQISLDHAGLWDLDEFYLWIGNNKTDIPMTVNAPSVDFSNFPFSQSSIRNKTASFLVPLVESLGFACPTQEKAQKFAAIHATVKSSDEKDSLSLNIVGHSEDNAFPFTVSCKETSVQNIELPQNRLRHGNKEAAHRRTQSCPAYPDVIGFNLTKANVTVAYDAWKLNELVTLSTSGPIWKVAKEQRKTNNYDIFSGFWDINDQALVAKKFDQDVCYLAIMGTMALNPFDQMQNLAICDFRVGGSDCLVRGGFFDAYNTSYQDELRLSIDACVASCTGNCELVVTGHSQGAAAAIVAAVDLRHYNPSTITFGSPRPFMFKDGFHCTDFNSDKHLRFINTKQAQYDSVPFGTLSMSMMLGRTILLDDNNWPLGYPGLNNDLQRAPENLDLHDPDLYQERMESMLFRNCFPIPAARWGNGHYCNYDDEVNIQYLLLEGFVLCVVFNFWSYQFLFRCMPCSLTVRRIMCC